MFTCAIVSLVVYQTSWQRIPKVCSKYCIITQVGEDCITSEWLGLIIFGFGSKKTLEKWWETTGNELQISRILIEVVCMESMWQVLSWWTITSPAAHYAFQFPWWTMSCPISSGVGCGKVICLKCVWLSEKIRNSWSWDLQKRKESVFLYNFCQEVKACNTEPCNGETKHLVVKR